MKCSFCINQYFPSKAAMLRHRRALHFGRRAPKEIDTANKIICKDHSRYLCEFDDKIEMVSIG